MLRLYHGKVPKVVSPWFTTLNWAGEGNEVCSVSVRQLSNLGWISLILLSHAEKTEYVKSPARLLTVAGGDWPIGSL